MRSAPRVRLGALASLALTALVVAACGRGTDTTLDLPEPANDQELARRIVLQRTDLPYDWFEYPANQLPAHYHADSVQRNCFEPFGVRAKSVAESNDFSEERAIVYSFSQVFETPAAATKAFQLADDGRLLDCLKERSWRTPLEWHPSLDGEKLPFHSAAERGVEYKFTYRKMENGRLVPVAVHDAIALKGRSIVHLAFTTSTVFPAEFRDKLVDAILRRTPS